MKIHYHQMPLGMVQIHRNIINGNGSTNVCGLPFKMQRGDMLILANGLLHSPNRADTLELIAVEKIKRGFKTVGWRMEEVNRDRLN
ncbi:MAG: hypothetical protein FWF59_12080 [Turicibacter sp.]|nr:hypothetical protein [Turicibacter sp.]